MNNMVNEPYLPYYKITGGPKPIKIGWGDIPTSSMSEIASESIPIDKIDFSQDIDAGFNIFYGIKWDEKQTKTVAVEGAPYKKWQDAHDSISDSAVTKPYRIILQAGVYNEEVTFSRGYIQVVGAGYEHTILKMTAVTNGLVNIGTGANNTVIEFEGITFDLGTTALSKFLNVTATGITLYFTTCRFYQSNVSSTGGTPLYTPPATASNYVYFTNCIFEGTNAGQLKIIGAVSGNSSDTIYLKSPLFKDGVKIGVIGNAHPSDTTVVYLTNGESTGNVDDLIVVDGGRLYLEGGRFGLITQTARILNVTQYGSASLLGAHFYAKETYSLIYTAIGSNLTIDNCEINGGDSALATNGTTNLKNSSFAKHSSGTGYDIWVGGGTCNVTFCKYTTSAGTITKVDENVDSADKTDGFHASQTPTLNTIPVRDAADTDIPMGSGALTGLRAPATTGESVRTTTEITEANLTDLADGGETALHSHAGGHAQSHDHSVAEDGQALAPTTVSATGNISITKTAPTHTLTDEEGNSAVLKRVSTGGVYNQTNKVYKPGTLGKEADFDGASNYIKCGDVLDFEYNLPFSIDFWMQSDSITDTPMLVYKQNSASPYTGWVVYMYQQRIYWSINQDATKGLDVKTTNQVILTAGANYHIVCTYDGSNTIGGLKIYVNDVSQALTTNKNVAMDATINTAIELTFAARNNGNNKFNGRIDELVIWDKALSSAEVTSQYNSGSGVYQSSGANKVGIWHFEDNANDSSGNAYHGTWTGTPAYVTGIVSIPGADVDTEFIQSKDGVASAIQGIHSFGHASGESKILGTPFLPDIASKATPIDADSVVQIDSADSNKVKKSTWTQIKAFLKTYFDTIYAAITHSHTVAGQVSGAAITSLASVPSGAGELPTANLPGIWEKVYEKEFGAGDVCTSFDITTWDNGQAVNGETDEELMIVGQVRSAATVNTLLLRMGYGAGPTYDAGANYPGARVFGGSTNGGDTFTYTGYELGYTGATGGMFSFHTFVQLKRTIGGAADIRGARIYQSRFTQGFVVLISQYWNNAVNDITGLRFISDVADGIGQSSHFTIFRKSK